MKSIIVFTPKLLTNSENDVTDSQVRSSSELLCQEMEVRVGRGQGRRGRLVSKRELREEIRTLRAML